MWPVPIAIVGVLSAMLLIYSQRLDTCRVIRLGLFWHFLGIVWIGIFSVVYLPGSF